MSLSLVTGATGFIGPRLVDRLLSQGDQVVCLVRPTSDRQRLERPGVRFAVGSLSDSQSLSAALEGVDTIYHLAGKTHAVSPEDYLQVNQAGVATLCEAAASCSSPPVFVLVSSLAAAGPSLPGAKHTEVSPSHPISFYGRSKLAGELAARRWAAEVPLSIVRPPVVFGPGDRDGLMIFKTIRRLGIHFVPQMQGLPLSLIQADDLANALVRVAERGERVASASSTDSNDSAGLYYAADPQVSSYAAMGRMAAAAMGRKVWVICRRKYPLLLPALAGDLYSRLTGKAPLLGMDKLREASATGWVCDPAKIIAQLGWQPTASIKEHYQQTAEWYRQEGWL